MRVLPSAVEHHSESLYAYKVLEAIGGCVRLTNGTRPRCGTEVTRCDRVWLERQLLPAVPGTTDRRLVRRALSFLPRSRGTACRLPLGG
jgi:hypothetical protein